MMRRLLIVLMTTMALAALGQTYTVRATIYHPGTAGVGWVTASGSRISSDKLNKHRIRWVALSPDLFKKGFRMGDRIRLTCKEHPHMNGVWVVKDRMARRMRNRIDLLVPRGTKFNPCKVKITKL